MWEEHLSSHAVDFIKLTCCPAVEQPTLRKTNSDDEPIPRMVPWKCAHLTCEGSQCKDCDIQKKLGRISECPPQCEDCGIEKKCGITKCPALTECVTPIKVMEWKLAPRAGVNKKSEQNTQIELTESVLPIKEVVARFVKQLSIARTHYLDGNWLNFTRRLDTNTFGALDLAIFTDFSATMDLRAAKTDNSSVDNHAVLAIYVVLHSPRDIQIQLEDGTFVTKRVHECDVWHFFGDSMSKGKKNDHVFHNACLKHIVEYYKRTTLPDLQRIIMWTDNCAAQYK